PHEREEENRVYSKFSLAAWAKKIHIQKALVPALLLSSTHFYPFGPPSIFSVDEGTLFGAVPQDALETGREGKQNEFQVRTFGCGDCLFLCGRDRNGRLYKFLGIWGKGLS